MWAKSNGKQLNIRPTKIFFDGIVSRVAPSVVH